MIRRRSKTCISSINTELLSKANKYKKYLLVKNINDLQDSLQNQIFKNGPTFLEILVKPGSRNNLGRPKSSPVDNKNSFMQFLRTNK